MKSVLTFSRSPIFLPHRSIFNFKIFTFPVKKKVFNKALSNNDSILELMNIGMYLGKCYVIVGTQVIFYDIMSCIT